MGERKFSIGEAIRFGWNTMRHNIGFFIGLLIVAFLIENLPGIIAHFASRDFPLISFVLYLVGWLLGFVVHMGLIKISLRFCDGIKGKLNDLLSSFNLLLPFIAGSIVYVLIIFGGFVLFIIPGIIWGIKFSLFPYFIVDEGLGPIEAMKASSRATTGAKWDLFLFGLLLGLINFVGAIVFFIGLFATISTSMVAYAYVYRDLGGLVEGVKKDPKESPKSVMYINLGF